MSKMIMTTIEASCPECDQINSVKRSNLGGGVVRGVQHVVDGGGVRGVQHVVVGGGGGGGVRGVQHVVVGGGGGGGVRGVQHVVVGGGGGGGVRGVQHVVVGGGNWGHGSTPGLDPHFTVVYGSCGINVWSSFSVKLAPAETSDEMIKMRSIIGNILSLYLNKLMNKWTYQICLKRDLFGTQELGNFSEMEGMECIKGNSCRGYVVSK
ncbi:hypothetical protein K2173_001270 [Erythroxylum novogranatense]|uniref:Glycine-rich protein n=1 Tax=Erythroxylum novogranatense TaxID=1862640 RepID=A0AAV8T4H0_9ROSI|nr:hypothetical protein K2173_001270 [Erythroxylum novogranatense]